VAEPSIESRDAELLFKVLFDMKVLLAEIVVLLGGDDGDGEEEEEDEER
jgi:hypothetical protein